MNIIRNILSLLGVIAIVVAVAGYAKMAPMLSKFEQFDPQALETYMGMMERLLETGNPAEATVWKAEVEDGQNFKQIDETIRLVANEYNIKNVGELPLWKQVESMTGEKVRIAKIYLFCDPLVAFQMMDYSDAYSAYLPCRISLTQDKKTGKFTIYTLNMDMMIYGGKPLPPKLKTAALKVKKIMLEVLKRGAEGDF